MARRAAVYDAEETAMAVSATYVYGLVKATRRPSFSGAPTGLPGSSSLEALPVWTGVWAIVADVPMDVYGPEPLEASLRRLDWVSNLGVAHNAVVEFLARRRGATVLPMKMFVMFSSRERVVADLRDRRKAIAAAFKRIAGSQEWGVRVVLAAGARTRRAPRAVVTSGAAFLAARKQARDSAREAVLAAADAAEHGFNHLSSIARDVRRRDDAPAGAEAPPLLDAVFLVPSLRRARFRSAARAAAAACRRAGATMTLTGPWPAYSFVQGPEGRA